ncbi:folylpolyglutamate synthase/dihydrofolate synthase family protein [Emticicia sp. BO119]|uniref:bifunctional folylpolyglutamate synthase/dihydrofolate synthase n=1 Tax=Emticicia sp. BO119 TaxID=2757768 RepID=UPI0015F025C3|nr:folylpolyglutamate synthase/dihydrofolate synthase family protein [Emticicia sp. BO119]MBA4853365.1 bifunctional folylpolyglutamate synthase/dihydrofolate synthase [Emticicia sp. BO119]
MNYEETINYLYNMLPVFHREGARAYKPNLNNTLALCEYLGNPHTKFKSIHIAGTNGKGSSSHYMASILQSAGYRTGLYTSPHLKDYSERFRINGKSIEKAKVVAFIEDHKDIIEKLLPSFFELSVALAFDFFAKENVDVAVIEVGLGGRLDSTNIISPDLSIITNIGFDHMDVLGNTLPKIALEKAGIIKANTPVVISERQVETSQVFIEKAIEQNAPIYFAEDNYLVTVSPGLEQESFSLSVDVYHNNSKKVFKEVKSQLIGKYQLKNLTGVFQSVEVLKNLGYKISEEAIRRGIAEVVLLTGLKGRWQVLDQYPLTICDTGHNEHGLKIILNQIDKLYASGLINGQKYFILGFVKDKNVEEILQLFPKDANYYFCQANSPRSMAAENLIKIAESIQLSGYSILNVNDALEKVRELAQKDDFIYIGGSTFVVAEINEL